MRGLADRFWQLLTVAELYQLPDHVEGLEKLRPFLTIFFFSLFFYLFHRTLDIHFDEFFFSLSCYTVIGMNKGNEIDTEGGVYIETMVLSARLAISHLYLNRVRATSKDGF